MSQTTSKYPNNPEQMAWIGQTKQGNQVAFNGIVNKYQQPVYNICYQMLGNAGKAEDAAQEVFLRAYSKLKTYDESRQFSTWLFAITSNYCRDQLKMRRFYLTLWDDLSAWHRLPDATWPQPEAKVVAAEVKQEVRDLLQQLPAEYRTMIILKYWHDMAYEDIAEVLNTTVSAVKSKLFRARKKMAQAAQQSELVGSTTSPIPAAI